MLRKDLTVFCYAPLPDSSHSYARILARVNNLPSALRSKTRNILGWIGCSPTPLTIQELEQAVLVDVENVKCSVRVSSSLNLVELCGPIVEVIDEYVQFVHFTVKEYAVSQAKNSPKRALLANLLRYIFNPRMDGYIDITEAALSLANRCIWYLCQSHHDPWVTDDEFEVADNIIFGDYRLHDYAVTTWLELVRIYVSLMGTKPLSSELIRALECLATDRANGEFPDCTELAGQFHQPDLEKFRSEWPELHIFLCHMVQFRWRCSNSEYQMSKGEITSLPCNRSSPNFSRKYMDRLGPSCNLSHIHLYPYSL